MNLNPGDRIELGGVEYTVERKLGSGAVALAYLAVTGEMQVVIKLPGVQDEARLDGMRDEARVLRTLNAVEDGQYGLLSRVVERIARSAQTRTERCVVALYDHGEFAGRPYLVQEVAPPEVNRRAVQTLSDEYRTITIMAKVARGMALAHDQGFALKDFEPPIKSDRIRVEWPESAAAPVVLLIDWNITGGRVDFRKDLFMFGGHLYAMLLGRSLELIHHRPPQTLGMGVPTWRNLSEGAQMLLAKLLHRDEQRRYLTSAELADDLIWHGQLLQTVQKDPPPPCTLHWPIWPTHNWGKIALIVCSLSPTWLSDGVLGVTRHRRLKPCASEPAVNWTKHRSWCSPTSRSAWAHNSTDRQFEKLSALWPIWSRPAN